jgi:hypothetical protein
MHSLPQALDAGRWKALNPADHLAVVRGIDDVPVRNVGGSRYHLLDPLSDRPYGPQLLAHEHDFSLGRSHYSVVKKPISSISSWRPIRASNSCPRLADAPQY